MRAMILVAMLATLTGCAWFNYATEYEAADRAGNQCRNECLAAADEYLLESCFKNCYHYHGGEFWPSASCAIAPPESRYKEPPPDSAQQPEPFPAPAEITPAPADSQVAPAQSPPAPPPAEPTTPAPAEPAPQSAPQSPEPSPQ